VGGRLRRVKESGVRPTADRGRLGVGDAGLIATRTAEVPLEALGRLRRLIAQGLPKTARLHIHARSEQRPTQPASSTVALEEGAMVLEVEGAGAPGVAALLEKAVLESQLPLRVITASSVPSTGKG
jgi:hypothetical protein